MPAVTRVDPKTIFTPDEWARISRQSVWVGPVLVLSAWAVIIGAGVLFVLWPNPLSYILAVMLIGTRTTTHAWFASFTNSAGPKLTAVTLFATV